MLQGYLGSRVRGYDIPSQIQYNTKIVETYPAVQEPDRALASEKIQRNCEELSAKLSYFHLLTP